jgi:hypothetical protein
MWVRMDFGAKVLLCLHAAAAVVLIGSATHNAILSVRQLMGTPVRVALQRLYVRVLGWAYLCTFALGLINYPTFRLDVREAYLDTNVPLATGFFEVKEHWIAIGLVILACYWPMSRSMHASRRTSDAWLYHVLGILMACIVWLAMLTGLFVTAIRPLGGVGT